MSGLKVETYLRPCYVAKEGKEVKALFHRWCDTIIRDEQTVSIAAIVEYEGGNVGLVYPDHIKFLDDPFLNYIFPGKEEMNND